MAAKKDTLSYLVIGLLCAIVLIFFLNSRSDKYSIPDDMRNRWEGGGNSTVWKAGASPDTCERNFSRCMEGCSMHPDIGCPGQCVEEREYCQEFSS